MQITHERKQELINEYKVNDNDTGSPEVQVAILTERIRQITEHLKQHKKDFATRRGLLQMVGQRSTLLKYLNKVDRNRYLTVIQRLGIRR